MCRGCDVLLDTVFFNAQTTAADFIWAAVLASLLFPTSLPSPSLSVSLALALSLSISLLGSLSHTHSLSLTHTHTLTHTHSLSLSHILSLTLSLSGASGDAGERAVRGARWRIPGSVSTALGARGTVHRSPVLKSRTE